MKLTAHVLALAVLAAFTGSALAERPPGRDDALQAVSRNFDAAAQSRGFPSVSVPTNLVFTDLQVRQCFFDGPGDYRCYVAFTLTPSWAAQVGTPRKEELWRFTSNEAGWRGHSLGR